MSFLEKLSREVRDRIYEFVYGVIDRNGKTIQSFHMFERQNPDKDDTPPPPERAALALLWVNRQIRDEVIFTPFSRPTFEGNLYRIHRHPEDLGTHRHLLQKVRARDISGPRLIFDET